MSGPAGIFADWDLCQRMWVAGWQVLAAKQVQMTHDQEVGGTHKPKTKELCWGKQLFIAREVTKVSFHVPLFTQGNGEVTLPTGVCPYPWMMLPYLPGIQWNRPPYFQSHINLDFEREVCGVARELTLKHLKLINSSK